jgi:hypothetical protein
VYILVARTEGASGRIFRRAFRERRVARKIEADVMILRERLSEESRFPRLARAGQHKHGEPLGERANAVR